MNIFKIILRKFNIKSRQQARDQQKHIENLKLKIKNLQKNVHDMKHSKRLLSRTKIKLNESQGQLCKLKKEVRLLKKEVTELNLSNIELKNPELVQYELKKSVTLLRLWSKRVREVGHCDTCKSEDKLTAHHVYDKHNHPSLMFSIDNGICLCEKCHAEFHKKYPAPCETTPSQYKEFKSLKQYQYQV